MIALCRENVDNQNKVCESSGIEPLVRLIKSNKSSERVLMTAIKTLGILCIGKTTPCQSFILSPFRTKLVII